MHVLTISSKLTSRNACAYFHVGIVGVIVTPRQDDQVNLLFLRTRAKNPSIGQHLMIYRSTLFCFHAGQGPIISMNIFRWYLALKRVLSSRFVFCFEMLLSCDHNQSSFKSPLLSQRSHNILVPEFLTGSIKNVSSAGIRDKMNTKISKLLQSKQQSFKIPE